MSAYLPASTLLGVAAAALAVGALIVPILARAGRRPRFVAGLCFAAIVVIAAELTLLLVVPRAELTTSLVGIALYGTAAVAVIAAHAVVQTTVAVGLWLLQPWARLAGMGYLGFLLASFLLWGLGGGHGRQAVYVLVWQLCVLPFLTFSFMYLYRGASHFTGDGGEDRRLTGTTDKRY